MQNTTALQEQIEQAWQNRELLKEPTTQQTINSVIELLDKGTLRIAEPSENGWKINEWLKKSVILYFLFARWKLLK